MRANAHARFQPIGKSAVFVNQEQAHGADGRVLELGQPIEREMAVGQSHFYQLALTSGQYAHVLVKQLGLDVVVNIFGPDGKLIDNVDDPIGTQGTEPVHITAEATGIYRLEVKALGENGRTGRYEAKLVELRPATQPDRDRLVADRKVNEAAKLTEQGTEEARKAAIEKNDEALSVYRAIDDRSNQFNVLLTLGYLHMFLGEHQRALEYAEQASVTAQALGDNYRHGWSLELTAHVYQIMGELEKALQFAGESLRLYQATDGKTKEITMLRVVGTLYNILGEHEKAREYYQRIIPLYQTLEDRDGETGMLYALGSSYDLQNEHQKAFEYWNQALRVSQATGNKLWEAGLQAIVSNEYARAGERQQALDHAAQALRLRPVGHRSEASILNAVGSAHYWLGDFEKALAYQSEALRLRRAEGDKLSEARILKHIAVALRAQGRLAEAKDNIENCIALLESMRSSVTDPGSRTSFLASLFEYYEINIDLLMRLHTINPRAGHDLTALAFTENVKARSLKELLTKARVDLRPGAGSTRLAALTEPQPLVVKEIQQQLDGNTILLEYELGDERSYLWAVTVDGVLSFQLPPRAEVEAQTRRVYQLLIARQPASGLTNAEQRAREVTADKEYQTQAANLSRMLLAPVASQLGAKRLLIVADGALQYLPFAALPVPASERTETTTELRPLILDHEIVSLPSASVLAVLRREMADRQPATKPVAVIADPVFGLDDARVKQSLAAARRPAGNQKQEQIPTSSDRSSTLNRALRSVRGEDNQGTLRRLLFSRDEAEAILSAVKPRQSGLEALDFRASRKMAMSDELSQYRIIHFSTHGLLDSRHPELSGLVLSLVDEAGQPQEGFLRLHEIYGLRLNADLVVLSACQTGLGKDVRGEGLIGLTRGFMYAGTPRVVASLWQVDDAATAELMKRFYRGVLQEKLPPVAALRAAQIEMIKKRQWQSPYYWGAFVLHGEWR